MSRFRRYFFYPRDGSKTLRAGVRWSRVCLVCATGIAMAFLLTGGAVAAYLRSARHLDVSYADVLAPWRWHHLRVVRGKQLIAEGFSLARAGRHREAVMHLRAGLAQVPAHRAGRLLQARLHAEARRNDEARQVLLDGIPLHAADARYLFAVFDFLLRNQEDDRIILLAQKLRPNLPGESEAAAVVGMAGATASFLRGNYDQADDFLDASPPIARSRDGRLLRTRVEWERGYRDLALLTLRMLQEERPADAEVQHELIHRLRESGAADEARRQSVAFQIAHPQAIGARIELLRAYSDNGDTAWFERETDAALRDFATDDAALLALGDYFATTGRVSLVGRVAKLGRERGPVLAYAFLGIEAQIVSRDYRGAIESIRAVLNEHQREAQPHRALLDSLQAVAYLALGERETSRTFLNHFLLQPGLRADNLLALANRFVALEAPDQARRILTRAAEVDPRNQAAVTRLVELDLNLNRIDELSGHLRLLLALRKPSPDVLRVARHKLGSDLFLFSSDRPAVLAAVSAALEQHRSRTTGR
ncbi:MAG: hypothetical protein Q7S40_10455 [Opitutaceae bacterium]|nr:hypothetical protein [Opitutaceae bacterium]